MSIVRNTVRTERTETGGSQSFYRPLKVICPSEFLIDEISELASLKLGSVAHTKGPRKYLISGRFWHRSCALSAVAAASSWVCSVLLNTEQDRT